MMKTVKRFFSILLSGITLLFLAGCGGAGKQAPVPAQSFGEADLSVLTAKNHPRLYVNAKTFKAIRRSLRKNPLLANLHGQMMEQAEKYGLAESPLTYKKDESNKRILHVSRAAITRIASAAYAYRMTGDKRYLAHAEKDLVDVCHFPDWNPSHFLDTGEMSLAVSIGYDWLYDVLSPETRKLIEETLVKYAFEAADGRWFYKGTNNWNQVCNAGLVSGALAIWETRPELCQAMVAKSIESNKGALRFGYYPDGNYPEGSTYWEYGTEFQCIMISALESVFGSDFGICQAPGFERTGDYEMHTIGNTLQRFNYSDCGKGLGGNPAVWFFAQRFNKPEVLFFEQPALENQQYVGNRTLFLALTCAAKAAFSAIPTPSEHLFYGHGTTPVAMMRTGWTVQDLYLGIKGGRAGGPHAHMDAGSFVFDAYGYRWASDYGQPSYSKLEKFFIEQGRGEGGLWDMKQDSQRWDLFAYNNKQHNTLTVNDTKFDVNGYCDLTGIIDKEGVLGASVDITPAFSGQLASAIRTASIVDKAYLEVRDALKAGAKPAHIRWTLVTYGKPEISADGILLSQGDVKMKLEASGAKVSYTSWPTDAASMGLDGKDFVKLVEGSYVIGFEFDIPKETEVNLVTTLKKAGV
ncbi:MAG: heparinase II/III family protein [Bacteroidales bacterium]|nr:heparinase II/III family protein [Bacteroidales bacterium]